MKTIITRRSFVLILSLFLLSFMPVAPVLIDNGQKVTIGTTETEYELKANQVFEQHSQLLKIQVDPANTGTIQFSVGVGVEATHQPRVAGERFLITVRNGVRNLHAKGSAANQSFSVTY